MPELRSTAEDPIQLHDALSFVTKQDIQPGQESTPAWTVEGKDDYIIGIERNTPFALEAYEVTTGDPLDPGARFVLQKTDPQGNPLGNAIIAEGHFSQFDYDKMRSDPEFFKTTSKSLILNEREFLHIYLDIPTGANNFDASESRMTIGDNVTQTGKPVFIRRVNDLTPEQRQAAQAASSGGQ